MSGVALVPGKSQLSDSNGNPLAGGTVDVYLAGTTTRTNSWQDQALTSLNTNPIVLDASGSCSMWLDGSTLYKLVVKNAAGATQPHLGGDNISGASGSGTLVSFLQAGTGAVSRSAQAKMRDVVSVKDFGAVGDGVTDDKAAIQAAIDAVFAAGGGEVVFPPSSSAYLINNKITLKLGVNLYGLGARLKRNFAYTVSNQAVQLDGNNVIFGLTYDGNATGIADAANFTLYHDFNCGATIGGQEEFFKFESCTFIDSPGSFILSNAARDLIVTGNKFYNYNDHCIYIPGLVDGDVQNVTITGNVFRAAASKVRDAIKTRLGVRGVLVQGNSFYVPGAGAITFDFGDATTFANLRSMRCSVVGNNGVCKNFVSNIGTFDGADGNLCIGDLTITGNVVDCQNFFSNGTNNWLQSASLVGAIDVLTITGNTIKGGNVVAFGVKNRPARIGTGGAATATLTVDAVTSIAVTNGGSGYTKAPAVSLRDATNSGFGATAKATVSGGAITAITVLTQGTGYTSAPTVFFEEYGIGTLLVKDNVFLPGEEFASSGPGAIVALGDIAYAEIEGNTWDAISNNNTGLSLPIGPYIVGASGQSRAVLANDVLRSSPCKARVFNIHDNYINSANTLFFETSGGYATDGSVFNEYDTYIERDNLFDLRLLAAATNSVVCTAGTATRASFYLTGNHQINNSAGRMTPDSFNQHTTWTAGAVKFTEPGTPRASATFDPPSIAAGASTTTTIAVTESYMGDTVLASFSNSLAGLVLTGYVSSQGTVTCVFHNPTAGAVDLASGTLSVKIVR